MAKTCLKLVVIVLVKNFKNNKMPQLDIYTFPTQIFFLVCISLFFLLFFSYFFYYVYFFESELVEKEYLFVIQQVFSKKFEKIYFFIKYQNLNKYYLNLFRLFF
jgi:hypothetical protein